SPREWEPGETGEERKLELVLKLIADIGLLGEPNAGKSTLLSVISAARPKIADYPFTTLEPHLGVVGLSDNRSFVVADIPGIIEGAHEGKGLGLRFLQHVERTRAVAVLVPVDSPDPQATYELLRREAASYSKELAAKTDAVARPRHRIAAPARPRARIRQRARRARRAAQPDRLDPRARKSSGDRHQVRATGRRRSRARAVGDARRQGPAARRARFPAAARGNPRPAGRALRLGGRVAADSTGRRVCG